jgi:hypothetical protein
MNFITELRQRAEKATERYEIQMKVFKRNKREGWPYPDAEMIRMNTLYEIIDLYSKCQNARK